MGYWIIRNDYFCSDILPEEGDVMASISIDGWKAGEEVGAVIARVLLSKRGDVLVDYHDPLARIDEEAQQAISEAKEQLKAYYQEKSPLEKGGITPPAQEVFCLCEEYEGADGIREFQILALSTDKSVLRQMMEHKIAGDEYGFIEKNGIDTHEDDHFITAFDYGFVEYYIVDQEVLCIPEHDQKTFDNDKVSAAKQCLIDNGIEADEAESVLQALGYILMDKELFPEGKQTQVPSLDSVIANAEKLAAPAANDVDISDRVRD